MTNLFQLKIRHFLFNFEQEVPYFFYSPKAAQGSPPEKRSPQWKSMTPKRKASS
jgi:hypothetical protein